RTYPQEIAAIIVEPVAANMGLVLPLPGFLEKLRELTQEYGALLIFDEVMTGFRVALGGMQEREGITPDLTCLGKIIGGGLPVGAYGGRREIMAHVAPLGGVYQAGTLSGNPLALSAGLATLAALRTAGVYERLERLGAKAEQGLVKAARKAGVPQRRSIAELSSRRPTRASSIVGGSVAEVVDRRHGPSAGGGLGGEPLTPPIPNIDLGRSLSLTRRFCW